MTNNNLLLVFDILLVSNIFDPWTFYTCRTLNKTFLNFINTNTLYIENLEKMFIKKHTGINKQICHGVDFLLNPITLNNHTCSITCTTPCHYASGINVHFRYSRVREYHKLMKCVQCGIQYISMNTAIRYFFISSKQLRCLDTYSLIQQPRRCEKWYKIHNVKWLSNILNHTPYPLWKYSRSREKRCKRLIEKFQNIRYPEPIITWNDMFTCTAFRQYILNENIKLHDIIVRYNAYVQPLLDYYNSLQHFERSCFHYNENTNVVHIRQGREVSNTLSTFLSIAIENDNIEYALKQARKHFIASNSLIYYSSMNINIPIYILRNLEDRYIEGDLQTTSEFYERVISESNVYTREQELKHWLMTIGININNIVCSTFHRYVYDSNSELTKYDVFQCVLNHIINKLNEIEDINCIVFNV